MAMRRVPFYLHDLGAPEVEALARVIEGPILSTGAQVADFEDRFARYLGGGHAVGLTSCTGGLQLALTALGIGPGDEVITTPQTFIATANAIVQAGATPVFADVEPETGNLSVAATAAAIGPRTRAILPVHLYGQMVDMKGFRALADRHQLALVEDSAHCVEGVRDGVRPGQLSDAAAFSFYATKNLSCGEGGAVLARDAEVARKLKVMRSHGMDRVAADRFKGGFSHWDMVQFGWKYNMNNLQAAMLLPQLERIEASTARRAAVWGMYETALSGVPGLDGPRTLEGVTHAHHIRAVWVAPEARDRVIKSLGDQGVDAAVHYRAVHLLSWFRETYKLAEGAFPAAEAIGARTITLPFYQRLSGEDVEHVAGALARAVQPAG